jgi:multidrug resistance efflux pump
VKHRRVAIWLVALGLVAAAGAALAVAVPTLPDGRVEIPTTKVARGPLKLTVYATGELRAGRTATLVAPPSGGSLRLVTLLQTGTPVKKDDVVMEFDPADQQYNLEQAKSDLAEAEQQIVKMRADSAVQASEDGVALLTARYDVRRGELNTLGNDLIGAIEAQKNVLTLREARGRLAQLEQDVQQRSATNEAALAVLVEKKRKAQLAMERAQSIIDSLVVKAPMDGLVSVKENRDASGGMYFWGMVLPEYREGDTVFSGRPVADVVESGRMEVRARINETDRDNLQTGQPARVQSDSVPGQTFTARVGALSGLANRTNFWETTAVRQFDVAFPFENPDPRLKPGSSVRLVIDGKDLKDAINVPRQAVFEKNGKTFVYLRVGDRFERRDVKVASSTESRAVLSGVNEGDVIALIDPDIARRRAKAGASAPTLPASGGPAR